MALHAADIAVLVINFVATIAIGAWSAWRSDKTTTIGYFLASASMNWPMIGFSIFMTNIGSSAVIGLSGSAAASGIPVICYELFGVIGILLMGYLFMPIFYQTQIYTNGEYLKRRFGSERLQLYISIQTLLFQILHKIPSEIYAGGLIAEEILNWNRFIGIAILLVMTALVTLIGGLTTVLVTDFYQGIVMIIGGTCLAIIVYIRHPSFDVMKSSYMNSVASELIPPNGSLWNSTSCGRPAENSFHIVRSITDPDYPWLGTLGGVMIICIWYFCGNQDLLQRCFAGKNLFHVKAGCVLASFLKLTPTFLFLIPGFISRIEYPDKVACVLPEKCEEFCHNASGCSNLAYIVLVKEMAPIVIKGLVIAATLSSIISTLTSIFNSGSTMITRDVYIKIRKQASEREQLIVGRVSVAIYTALGLALIPVLDTSEGGQMFHYLQAIASFIAPPILSMYLLALLWERTNEKGAFWGSMIAVVFGMVRLIATFVLPAPPCGTPDNRPNIIKNFHYLHYNVFLFVLTTLCIVTISLLTKTSDNSKIQGLTWWTKLPLAHSWNNAVDIKDNKKTIDKNILDIQLVGTQEELGQKENALSTESQSENGATTCNITIEKSFQWKFIDLKHLIIFLIACVSMILSIAIFAFFA